RWQAEPGGDDRHRQAAHAGRDQPTEQDVAECIAQPHSRGEGVGGAAKCAPGRQDDGGRGRQIAQRGGDKAGFFVHRRISSSGMDVIDPSRSRSSVTSSMSVSKRTGTSNSKPAVIATPAPGAVVKATLPVAVSTLQPVICSTPFRVMRTVPATGLAMARAQLGAPEV